MLPSAGYIAGERVIFLGRKEPSSFGALIDRYVKDYVICPVCGSPDTRTEKSKKLGFYYAKHVVRNRPSKEIMLELIMKLIIDILHSPAGIGSRPFRY